MKEGQQKTGFTEEDKKDEWGEHHGEERQGFDKEGAERKELGEDY